MLAAYPQSGFVMQINWLMTQTLQFNLALCVFFLPCVSPEVSCYERKHIVSSLFHLPFKYLKDTKGSPFGGEGGISCFSLYPISIAKFLFEQQETAGFSVFFLNFS